MRVPLPRLTSMIGVGELGSWTSLKGASGVEALSFLKRLSFDRALTGFIPMN
jgi:hypothetical protein